jgi:RNA polymerase sigma factor (sigma-70 family)
VPTAAHLLRLARDAAPTDGPPPADTELLQRYVSVRDEAAFAELVRRNGPLVLRACRHILGEAGADDAFQAVFLLLVRSARRLTRPGSLAGWLHAAAVRIAANAHRGEERRRKRERSRPVRTSSPDDLTWREVREVLDREIAALPERHRLPLLLCHVLELTYEEAARCAGCPVGALRDRLERGKDQLRKRLARYGLPLAAPALVLGAPPPVSAGLVEATMTTVHSGICGTIPPAVASLLPPSGGMRITFFLIPAAVALVGIGAVLASNAEQPVEQALPAASTPEQHAARDEKADPPNQQMQREVRVVVLDPQGKPIPDANVHVSIWTNEKDFKANRDIETDAEGIARVELPKTYTIVRLWASKKPFVGLYAGWEQAELSSGKGLPAEYTFCLENAVSAGGRVVDEKGKPVAGAKVKITLESDPRPAKSDGRVRYNTWLAEAENMPTTDADGRWKIDNVPDHPEVELHLLVTHPNYVSDERWNAKTAGVTTKMFREGTSTVTLKSGIIVRGKVTGPDGKPIKDAVVIHGDDPYWGQTTSKFATNAEGRYRLPALPAGPQSLTVMAPGFAPQLRKVELKLDLPDQDFRMAAGKPVRLRITDADGKPIPKAYVYLHEWNGSKSIYSDHNPNHPNVPDTGIPRRADAEGTWSWLSAPDEPVKVQIHSPGFASLELEVTGGATDRTVTLKSEHRVTGAVTDAVTGKPIPAFSVIQVDVFGKDWLVAERYNAVAGKNGRVDYLARRTDIPLRLRVEAQGYRTLTGPEFRVGDDAGRKQEFRLQPSRPITGRVVDAAGNPAAKAEVVFATPTDPARNANGDNHLSITDAAGRFEFPDPGEPWSVIAQTDAGVAIAEFPASATDAGALKLRPWASVRGRFQDGGKPIAGARVFITPIRLDSLERPRVETFDLQVLTDANGRFDATRVPPGPVSVRVSIGPWKDEGYRSGPSVPLDLKPGENADLNLGSGGAIVNGRVKLTGKVPAELNCTYSLNYLVPRSAGVSPPPEVAAAGFDATKGWHEAWQQTPEGLAYLSTLHSWFVKLAPDGTFRVSGVPPGDYDLAIAVYAKPEGCLVEPLARQVARVTVTAADAARGELKLPDIPAEVVPIPVIGETPILSFQSSNGKPGTLVDFRGKHTVVHFWASWCAPCKKQLPALKELHQRFADRGVAMVGLSLDENAEAWREALKTSDLPWAQGRPATDAVTGAPSVPTYWLLDPTGKMVAKVYDTDELAKELEMRLK